MDERFPVMTITIRRALVVAATTVALFGVVRAQQPASQPPAPFKSGVDVVHVDVSVLDKERRPVRGLSTADFVVREDGKVRPVVAFSEVELPPRPGEPLATWMRDAAADVVTNQVPRDGRLVVILIDRTIRPDDMPAARRTAESAVDQMGPGDLAAVVFTTQTPPQNFTADRSILRAAINRTFAGLADDGSETERGECKCGVCTLETMTIVADSLRDVPERRKMLLFIGASVPVISTAIACGDEVRNARETLLRAAGVANLAIHSVDSNLLETLAPSAQEANPPANRSDVVLDHLKRQGNLAVYPGYTGGRAIQNTNAPQDVMPAVFAESQSYYVLGFTPASPNADGRYHGIKVEVKRRGVSVHPRQGYYAPSVETAATPAPLDEPPPSLVKALAGFWPSTGLPLSVGAAAFADPDKGDASVAVVVRAQGRVASGEQGQRGGGDPVAAEMRVNVLAGAYDRDGRSMSSHMQTLRVPRPPDAAQEFEYEALSRLRLKPGRHEVRVAVDDPSRRTSGSVYTYVEVPDFAKAAVSLSGVVLSTDGASRRQSIDRRASADADGPTAVPIDRRRARVCSRLPGRHGRSASGQGDRTHPERRERRGVRTPGNGVRTAAVGEPVGGLPTAAATVDADARAIPADDRGGPRSTGDREARRQVRGRGFRGHDARADHAACGHGPLPASRQWSVSGEVRARRRGDRRGRRLHAAHSR